MAFVLTNLVQFHDWPFKELAFHIPDIDHQMRLRWNATMQKEAFEERADQRHVTMKREMTGASLSKRDFSARPDHDRETRSRKFSIVRFKFHSTSHEGDEEIG
jgi:hypothetical protein